MLSLSSSVFTFISGVPKKTVVFAGQSSTDRTLSSETGRVTAASRPGADSVRFSGIGEDLALAAAGLGFLGLSVVGVADVYQEQKHDAVNEVIDQAAQDVATLDRTEDPAKQPEKMLDFMYLLTDKAGAEQAKAAFQAATGKFTPQELDYTQRLIDRAKQEDSWDNFNVLFDDFADNVLSHHASPAAIQDAKAQVLKLRNDININPWLVYPLMMVWLGSTATLGYGLLNE